VCVWIYLIELKTHARSENKKILLFFMFHMKQREQKRNGFFHPVNTHTYIHLRAKKNDKDT